MRSFAERARLNNPSGRSGREHKTAMMRCLWAFGLSELFTIHYDKMSLSTPRQ